jgi:hypothetical protein
VYQAAMAYSNCSDILSVNSYYEFYKYPYIAGLVVDAIKEACGKEKPVWLFFDGGAHRKPHHISQEEYINSMRCQVYCSIVHGASGVLFWSQSSTHEDYWQLVYDLASELGKNSFIYKSQVIESGQYLDIHFRFWKNDDGNEYFIGVNTNQEKSINFDHKKTKKIKLRPLEVKIIRL